MNDLSTIIESSDTLITITDNSGYFGSLPIDSIRENFADPYTVSASASAPQGHAADFRLIATADDGFVDTTDFSICVGVSVPSDTGYYYVYYSGGPHAQSPEFEWIAIDSTQTENPGVSLSMFDNLTVIVSLPFTFRYYGEDYNEISICSNGWIAMGAQTDADWTNSTIPHPDGPQAMIAGLWDDLDPGNEGEPSDVYYYYDEEHHRFIVEYFMVEHAPAGDYETFEIVLCDPVHYPTPTGDGEIYVQYLNAMQQTNNTLGIESPDETVGILYFFNETYDTWAVPVTDQFALRYTTYALDEIPGIEEFDEARTLAENVLMVYPSVAQRHINIAYAVAETQSRVALKIYDVTGRLIKNFHLQSPVSPGQAGRATISYDGSRLPAGIYFVQLETTDYNEIQKFILIE